MDDEWDEAAQVRATVSAHRASTAFKAHQAAGLCTMHDGRWNLCRRPAGHVLDDSWPPRHEFAYEA